MIVFGTELVTNLKLKVVSKYNLGTFKETYQGFFSRARILIGDAAYLNKKYEASLSEKGIALITTTRSNLKEGLSLKK